VHVHQHLPRAQLPIPRECPPLTEHFIGRETLIEKLRELLLQETEEPVTVLCGMGGVGKTTLVKRVATLPEMESALPDGTVWIDLSSTEPMAALLHVAAVYDQDVSGHITLAARSAAVRSVLRERRMLLVIDDAKKADEARALLPGAPGCVVLITTRDASLAANLTGELVDIPTLTPEEAARFLQRLAGETVFERERSVCQRLLHLLGDLPLAIEIAGKHIRKEARNTWFKIADFVGQLETEQGRIGLRIADSSLYACLNVSFEHSLHETAREGFRRFGAFFPGDFFLAEVAAALNVPETQATQITQQFCDLSLLQQIDHDRFRFHPLLRDFARAKFAELPEAAQSETFARLSDYHSSQALAGARPWRQFADAEPVIRAFDYACAAKDRERARKVFPHYEGEAVPGFLARQGYGVTAARMYEAELAFMADANPYVRAFTEFWAGHFWRGIDTNRALAHLRQAADLLSQLKGEAWYTAFRRVSFDLGHALAERGFGDEAYEWFQKSWKEALAREDLDDGLLSMLQGGDVELNLRQNSAAAVALYEQVRQLAAQHSLTHVRAKALVRLAERSLSAKDALAYAREALSLACFVGSDGARYLHRLGLVFEQWAINGEPCGADAIAALQHARALARDDRDLIQEVEVLYRSGNVLEHAFLLRASHAAPDQADEILLAGSCACYQLADQYMQEMEVRPALNPRERIETRLRQRVSADKWPAFYDEVLKQPEQKIAAAHHALTALLM
jgi:hypothetical protein